jgi:hypothetical protein
MRQEVSGNACRAALCCVPVAHESVDTRRTVEVHHALHSAGIVSGSSIPSIRARTLAILSNSRCSPTRPPPTLVSKRTIPTVLLSNMKFCSEPRIERRLIVYWPPF